MIKPSYEIRSDRDSDFNSFGNTFGGSCYLKGTVFQMCVMWFQKNKNFEAFFKKKTINSEIHMQWNQMSDLKGLSKEDGEKFLNTFPAKVRKR